MVSLGKLFSAILWFKRWVVNAMINVIGLGLILSCASFLYGTFYYLYMPTQSYHVPLDLTFDPCDPQDQNTKGIFKCSFPSATVQMPHLSPETPYSVSVEFQFTSSGSVQTFLTCIQGLDQEVCKPLTLAAKTGFASFVDFMLLYPSEVISSVLLLGGVSSASDLRQTVTVEFMTAFIRQDQHLHDVRVVLKDVSVIVNSACLSIHKTEFNKLQHLMWNHPLVSETVSIIALSLSIVGVASSIHYVLTRPKSVSRVSPQDVARARLGRIDSTAILRDMFEDFLETSSPTEKANLIQILARQKPDLINSDLRIEDSEKEGVRRRPNAPNN